MLVAIAVLVVLVLVLATHIHKNPTTGGLVVSTNTDSGEEKGPKVETLEGDLLCAGPKQKINITVGDDEAKIEVVENRKTAAANVFDYDLVQPPPQYSLIKIDQNKSWEYIRWDQTVGPHRVETLIFTADGNTIRPALAADYENRSWYAPFWSNRNTS